MEKKKVCHLAKTKITRLKGMYGVGYDKSKGTTNEYDELRKDLRNLINRAKRAHRRKICEELDKNV